MSVYGYKYGRVPEALLYSDASDRACRLHALLTRWADTRTEQPTRQQLAGQLRCSVDSLDRALKELETRGLLHIVRRCAEGTKVHIASDYILEGVAAEMRPSGPAETPEPAGDGGRKGAARGYRKGAATNKERDRSKKEQKNLPTPPATAPETEKAASTQTLLKEHLDALGHDLTTKGRLAATIKGCLGQGGTPQEVRAALSRMRERNVTQPSALPGFIDQVRGEKNGHGIGYRNGQPERRGPTIPEADLSQLPPTDPDKLAAWYDRQLEGIPT